MVSNADELVHVLGPFAAFVVATFDRSGLPLLVGTVCAIAGAAGGHFAPTIFLAALGMSAGDFFLYEVGRHSGVRAAFGARIFRPLRPLRSTARAILRKYPSASLVFGRYVAGAGIILPLLAGAFGMQRRRAYGLCTIGSVLYILPWCSLAFILGTKFKPFIDEYSGDLAWLAVAGVVGVVGWFAYARLRRRERKAAAHLDHPGGKHPHH